jgi:hypothetical protein
VTVVLTPASVNELPERPAVRLVERREPAVVAADEQQAAGRDDGAAVADLAPLLAPELVRREVERRENSAVVGFGLREARPPM